MVRSQWCNLENTNGSQNERHFHIDRRQYRCAESHSYGSQTLSLLPVTLSHLENVDSFGLTFQTGGYFFSTNHLSTVLDNHASCRNALIREKAKPLVYSLLNLRMIRGERGIQNRTIPPTVHICWNKSLDGIGTKDHTHTQLESVTTGPLESSPFRQKEILQCHRQ